jgi:hypothetical protein
MNPEHRDEHPAPMKELKLVQIQAKSPELSFTAELRRGQKPSLREHVRQTEQLDGGLD